MPPDEGLKKKRGIADDDDTDSSHQTVEHCRLLSSRLPSRFELMIRTPIRAAIGFGVGFVLAAIAFVTWNLGHGTFIPMIANVLIKILHDPLSGRESGV